MPYELESLGDQLNRLERQLRVIKIAAVVLAVLAIAFALAPRRSAQLPESIRRVGLRINDPNGVERFDQNVLRPQQ